MSIARFHPLCRNDPELFLEVDLVPACFAHHLGDELKYLNGLAGFLGLGVLAPHPGCAIWPAVRLV